MEQIEYLGDGKGPLSVFDARVSEITVQHHWRTEGPHCSQAGAQTGRAERFIRREAAKAKEAGGASPWLKVPDGVITLGGQRVAVEVESEA